MIKVEVLRDKETIKSISVTGHSGYEEIGKDIVCSSVSTAMILSINLLEKLNVKFDFKQDEKIPYMSLTIDHNFEQDNVVQTILSNLVSTLDDVSKQFKKNLKITKN